MTKIDAINKIIEISEADLKENTQKLKNIKK